MEEPKKKSSRLRMNFKIFFIGFRLIKKSGDFKFFYTFIFFVGFFKVFIIGTFNLCKPDEVIMIPMVVEFLTYFTRTS